MSLAERLPESTITPMPPNDFHAMVVASSPERRRGLTSTLRSLGAREVIEADGVIDLRTRAQETQSRDVAVVDGYIVDGSALGAIGQLHAAGWQRAVLLSPRSDGLAVRAAISSGVRNYVVMPDEVGAEARVLPFVGRGVAGEQAPLSDREVQVLQLVADGQSNKDVGNALGLSALTVKSHLARISRKLLTGDRAEMVAIAMRQGRVH